MGTWGVGSFDNDTALDFAGDLGESGRFELVEEALRVVLDPAGTRDASRCEVAVAATEIVAASRGLSSRPPDGLARFFKRTAVVASEEQARLAIEAIGRVATPGSGLYELWAVEDRAEGGLDDWLAFLGELGERLRQPPRPVKWRVPPGVKPRIGDVFELTPPSGRLAYVQYCGEGPDTPAVRVLPGRFDARVVGAALTDLVAQEHRFIVQQSLEALLDTRVGRAVANIEVPADATAPAFRIGIGNRPTVKNPHGWSFKSATFGYITGAEFSERFPDVDQTTLAEHSIPFPATLAMRIDHEWQPSADPDGNWGIPRANDPND